MEAKARSEHKAGKHTVLFKVMKEHDRDRLTSGIWARALKAKDPLAEKLIDRAVLALGAGIASAVNLLDVEAVIVGGGLGVRLGEPYVKRIREAMAPHLFSDDHPPALHVAALGDLGGAIGAALLSANRDKRTAAELARADPRPARAQEATAGRRAIRPTRRAARLATRPRLGRRPQILHP